MLIELRQALISYQDSHMLLQAEVAQKYMLRVQRLCSAGNTPG